MHTFLHGVATIWLMGHLALMNAAGYHNLTEVEYQDLLLQQQIAQDVDIHNPLLTPPQLSGEPQYGAFSPTGGASYRLYSSISGSATTITLSSFKEPVSNIPYTMTYLGSDVEYGTLGPQTSLTEFISFTGITQNSDGTAQLSGVTRGLTRTPAGNSCTASTTLAQAHSGQSIFILSDPPCFFSEYATKRNTQSITGSWNFASTSMPHYDATPSAAMWAAAVGTEFVDLNKLNSVVLTGCANASELTNGCAELATGREAASSTSLGGTGARLVLPATLASSSPSSSATSTLVMTQLDGRINPNFLATSSLYTYNLGAAIIFQASTTMAATTTIAASSLTNNALVLNGVATKWLLGTFPTAATQNATSTFLAITAAGIISPARPDFILLASTTVSGAVATTTITIGATSTDLIVVFDSLAMAGTNLTSMQFNSDTGANYDWTAAEFTSSYGRTAGSANKAINLEPFQGPFFEHYEIHISNIPGRVKKMWWTGDRTVSPSTPIPVVGAGVWNNTTQSINTISFGNNGTIPAGTRISVYGSAQ